VNVSSGAILRSLLLVLSMAVCLAAPATGAAEPRLKLRPLDIVTAHGVAHFTVEVADTPKTREHGLMFRKSLAPDRGMLFDFKTPHPVTFWMKNTLIPLDMIFIGPDGRIVSIARNAEPLSETNIPSGGTVLGVLEIIGGRADQIGAAPGDKVRNAIFGR